MECFQGHPPCGFASTIFKNVNLHALDPLACDKADAVPVGVDTAVAAALGASLGATSQL